MCIILRNRLLRCFAERTAEEIPSGIVEYHADGLIPYLTKRLSDGSLCDKFKISVTTDLHLCGEHTDFTLAVLARFLEREKPDLVVLCGDIVTGKYLPEVQQKLKDFFEERSQYWTFVLGNHDGEQIRDCVGVEESRKWAFDMLVAPHCLARKEGGGFGYNHVLNLQAKNTVHTLFLMDSGDRTEEKYCAEEGVPYTDGYDFIKKSQTAWYREKLRAVTEQNGGKIPQSTVFLHIPLPEYETAWEKRKTKEAEPLYGDNWEGVGCSPVHTDFFECLVRGKSTKTVLCGHDHVNCFSVRYRGIELAYAMGLTYDTYNRRNRFRGERLRSVWYGLDKKAAFYTDGITVLIVTPNGATTVPKYSQQEGVFDGRERELKKACRGKTTYRTPRR